MLKISIIINDIHPLIISIQNYLKELGNECELIYWSHLTYKINNFSVFLNQQENYDCIYIDRLGEGTLSYASQILLLNTFCKKIVFVNSPEAYLYARDKALMASQFYMFDIPFPETNICFDLSHVHKIIQNSSTYIVAKSYQGYSSNEIAIFNKENVNISFIKKILDRDSIIIIQEYIDNSKEYIWRIDIVDGEIIVCNRRYRYNAEGKPICNGTHGGKIIFYDPKDLDEKIKLVALETAKKLNLLVTGIDIILDSQNNVYVIEANPEPDITLNCFEFPYAIANLLIKLAMQKRLKN